MNSDSIKEMLETLHKVFPLPTDCTWEDGVPFRGTHGIMLTKPNDDTHQGLEIGVWMKGPDGFVVNRSVIFSNEELTEKCFLEIRDAWSTDTVVCTFDCPTHETTAKADDAVQGY